MRACVCVYMHTYTQIYNDCNHIYFFWCKHTISCNQGYIPENYHICLYGGMFYCFLLICFAFQEKEHTIYRFKFFLHILSFSTFPFLHIPICICEGVCMWYVRSRLPLLLSGFFHWDKVTKTQSQLIWQVCLVNLFRRPTVSTFWVLELCKGYHVHLALTWVPRSKLWWSYLPYKCPCHQLTFPS